MLLILFLFILVPNLFILGHVIIFGSPIDYYSIMTILDTNPAETTDFLTTFFSLRMIPFILILLSPFVLIYFIHPVTQGTWKMNVVIVLSAIIILILTLPRNYVQREIASFSIYDMYKQAKIDKETFISHLKLNTENAKSFTNIDTSNLKSDGNVFVVVLGESAYRGRMSCYGYDRGGVRQQPLMLIIS